MPRLHKVSRLLLLIFIFMVIAVPLSVVTAKADVGDILYIVVDMEDSYVYEVNPITPVSVKYYEDSAHLSEVYIDEDDLDFYYFEASDLVNPLASAPKDVGSYVYRVAYHDITPGPDYDDVVFDHPYTITKANIHILAQSFERPYNNSSDDPYEYDFDNDTINILITEYPLLPLDNNMEAFKVELFGADELNRELGNDVGEYDILCDNLELNNDDVDHLNANNYNLSFTSNTYTITEAHLEIQNISVDNKVYDSTTDGTITTAGTNFLTGVYGEDDVTLDLTNVSVVFSNKNIGTGINATLSGYVLAGADSLNYYVDPTELYTANITVRSIDITAVEISRVYDPDYVEGMLDYDINADDLAVLETEFGTTDLAVIKSNFSGLLTRNGDNTVGDYTISQGTLDIIDSGSFNDINYNISFTVADYEIYEYELNIDITPNQSKIYGAADPVFTYTLSELTPLYAGDALSGALARSAGVNVGTYDILIGTLIVNNHASNYNINLVNATDAFTINLRVITITADDKTITYGDLDELLTCGVTSGSLASGDSITGVPVRIVGTNAGIYDINVGNVSVTNSANYTITFTSGIYTIECIELDISVDPLAILSKSYGDPDPDIDFILSIGTPILAGHTISGSLGRESGIDEGFYELNTSRIIIEDSESVDVTANYNFTLDTAISGGGEYMFEIYRDEIFINLNMIAVNPYNGQEKVATPMFYDDAAFTVTVLISQASYEIYYYVRDSATPLLFTPYIPGLYTAEVQFFGTDNYLPKVETFNYEIARAVLTISGIGISNKIYDTTTNATITGTPVLNGTIINPARLSLVTTGATATFDNQNVNWIANVVAVKNVTVSGYTLAGLDAAYYDIALPITLTAKINPATLNISAEAVTREYNPLVPEGVLGYNINSVLNLLAIEFGTSNLNTIKSRFTGALHRDAGSSVGTYTINVGTLSLPVSCKDNYNMVFTSSIYRITPINLIVTVVSGQTKVYGNPDPVSYQYNYDTNKLLPGDVLVGSLVRVSGNNAGNYNITIGTLTLRNMNGEGVDVGNTGLGNYNVTLVSNPFIITKRPIKLRADNVGAESNKLYYGDEPVALTDYIAEGGLAYTDYLTGAITRVSGNNAGVYAITVGTRSISNAASYTITFVNGTYTISKRMLMIKVDPSTENHLSKIYGEDDPNILFIVDAATPLLAGHNISGSLGRTEGENADYYALNTSRILISDVNSNDITANYAMSLNITNYGLGGTYVFTINKKLLTVTAKDKKVEKGKTYVLQLDYEKFVFGDTKDDLDVVFTTSVPSPLVEGINIITVNKAARNGGAITEDKNYTFTLVTGKLTIIDNDNIPEFEAYPNDSDEFNEYKNNFKGFTYYKGVTLYDGHTLSGNEPNRSDVIATIDLPEDLADANKVGVLFFSADGVEVIPCIVIDGQVQFTFASSGLYMIAKPISGFFVIVLPVIGLGLIIFGIIMLIRYRKKNKVKRFKPSKASIKAKKNGGYQTSETGNSKGDDFSSSGFDSLVDTGEGTNETVDYYKEETVKSEPSKKESKLTKKEEKLKAKLDKHSSDVIIMDDVDAAMEKPVTMKELIEKPKVEDTFKAKAMPNDNLQEEDFLSVLNKVSPKSSPKEKTPIVIPEPEPEIIPEEKVVKEKPKKVIDTKAQDDMDDILEQLRKSEPKPNREAISSGIFGNVQNDFSDIASSSKDPVNKVENKNPENYDVEDTGDDDDDLGAPAYKSNKQPSASKDFSEFENLDIKDQEVTKEVVKGPKAKPDYNSFESIDMNDLSDEDDDIKPLAAKRNTNEKASLNKAVPNANAPKKPIDKAKAAQNEFANMNDLDNNTDSAKQNTEGKIVRQGGARRFDE